MCQKPELDEAQRGLVPARIEPHEARIAVELEGADGAAGRQEAQRDRRRCRPSRVDAGWIENSERSDSIGYSSRTSSSCWFQ